MKRTARVLLILFLILSQSLGSLASAETIDINATVPARPTDFSVEIASLTSGTTFRQNTTLSYQITYGSTLNYPANIQVQAEWSRGTVSGDSTPTVDILDYVLGSASTAYNSTPPVVDTVNRTITWTIPAFPANTQNQTVTFDLKTTDSYTGNEQIDFTVSGRVEGPGTVTPDSSITQSYVYDISIAPTLTPTPTALPTATPRPTSQPQPTSPPGPQATPTPTVPPIDTTTPTPTPPSPKGNTFTAVTVRGVSATDATIFAATSQPTQMELRFGTSPLQLTQLLSTDQIKDSHLFTVPALLPNTTYYFQLTATASSNSISSDIYTFTTAPTTTHPLPSVNNLVITSDNTILYSLTTTDLLKPFTLMLPTATTYTLRLGLSESDYIDEIILLARDRSHPENEQRVTMTEIEPGVYQGKLISSLEPSRVDIFTRIATTDNALSERQIGNVFIVAPMRIVNKDFHEPVESARVKLLIWNEREKRFRPLTSNIVSRGILFSDVKGIVPIVLPPGRYKAKISALGFHPQDIVFTIGPTENAGYPLVKLDPRGFDVLALLTYLKDISSDFLNGITHGYPANFTASLRFFHLLAASTLLALTILTLLSFFSRSRLTPALLPFFLLYHLRKRHPRHFSVKGIVIDHETSHPLSGVNIYALAEHTQRILSHAVTNHQGAFILPNIPEGSYHIEALRSDYLPFSMNKNISKTTTELQIAIAKKELPEDIGKKVWHLLEGFLSFSFELWLLLSFILLILVGESLGWLKILGFLALACFNLTIWSLHRR